MVNFSNYHVKRASELRKGDRVCSITSHNGLTAGRDYVLIDEPLAVVLNFGRINEGVLLDSLRNGEIVCNLLLSVYDNDRVERKFSHTHFSWD